jgi:hypothetical protein
MSEGAGHTFSLVLPAQRSCEDRAGARQRTIRCRCGHRPSSWWTTTIVRSRSSRDQFAGMRTIAKWSGEALEIISSGFFRSSVFRHRMPGPIDGGGARIRRARRPPKVMLSSGFPDLKSGRPRRILRAMANPQEALSAQELQDALQAILGEDEPRRPAGGRCKARSGLTLPQNNLSAPRRDRVPAPIPPRSRGNWRNIRLYPREVPRRALGRQALPDR